MEIAKGFYGRIAPRSGLSIDHSIDVVGGLIHSDFRGVSQVFLINHSSRPFLVNLGDKIVQPTFERIESPVLSSVMIFLRLKDILNVWLFWRLELLNKNVSYENHCLRLFAAEI